MGESAAYTCTLTADEQAHRRVADRQLRGQLRELRAHEARSASLVFAAGSEPLVRGFVRAESRCCSFFRFDVEIAERQPVLHVAAPHGAEDMLTALVDHLAGAQPPPGEVDGG